MTGDLRIPVSRRNRAQALEWYGNQTAVVSMEQQQVKRKVTGKRDF
jgi:hypothetical protein